MRSRFLLSLWLLGGLLYAGSTIFLAHTLLGGAEGKDQKSLALAASADRQCTTPSEGQAQAEPEQAEPEQEPQKSAAVDSKEGSPAAKSPPAQSSTKATDPEPSRPEEAQTDSTSAPGAADYEGLPGEDADQAYNVDPDADSGYGPDPEAFDAFEGDPPLPGRGEEDSGEEEWARVVAGTADMRSEPSLQSPMIYALPAGWRVRVISRAPGWVQVQEEQSGAAGWVDATALAPAPAAGPDPWRDRYGYGPRHPNRYANEAYPPPPPYPGYRPPRSEFGEFLRRALGGW